MAMHWDIKCAGCAKTNMVHYRYKCLRCFNYDLCAMCYGNKVETGLHMSSHPFQCLLDKAALELFFAGEPIPELCADSFTCPICGKVGHSAKELVKHVQAKHRGNDTPVICPLCSAVPEAVTPRTTNLVNHVSIKHGTGILRIGGGAGSTQGRTTAIELLPVFGGATSSSLLQLARSPTNGGRRGSGGTQWPMSVHSLGSSASQEEDFNPEAWLPELSSRSDSMHTMRDTDINMVSNSQQLRNSTPVSPQLFDEPQPLEEEISDLEPLDDISGNEPTSSM